MLQSLNTLIGSAIHARDGEMGTAADYLLVVGGGSVLGTLLGAIAAGGKGQRLALSPVPSLAEPLRF